MAKYPLARCSLTFRVEESHLRFSCMTWRRSWPLRVMTKLYDTSSMLFVCLMPCLGIQPHCFISCTTTTKVRRLLKRPNSYSKVKSRFSKKNLPWSSKRWDATAYPSFWNLFANLNSLQENVPKMLQMIKFTHGFLILLSMATSKTQYSFSSKNRKLRLQWLSLKVWMQLKTWLYWNNTSNQCKEVKQTNACSKS